MGTTTPLARAAAFPGGRLDEELADFLSGRDIGWREAIAVAKDHEWLDRVHVVDYDADPTGVLLVPETSS